RRSRRGATRRLRRRSGGPLRAAPGAPRGGSRRHPGGGRRARTRDPRRDRGGGDAPVRGTSRGQSRGRRGVARRGVVAWLVATALRHRVVGFLAAVALVVVGVQAARESPLDVFPEFAPPVVEIQTEAAGLAAEDVEALVTTPLERALGGLPDLTLLRSS